MNKSEFLSKLRNSLDGLPQDDINERIAFYGEIIDDRIEEGATEEQAVSGIGTVEEIVNQIIEDIPLQKIVKEKIKPKRRLKAWEITLIILGFPLWFPIIISAGAVVLSLYITLWAAIVSLWAVDVSLWAYSLAGFVCAVLHFINGFTLPGISMIGIALFCAGISIFAFFGCLAVSKCVIKLTKKIAIGIKSAFLGKESAK